jgi:hypothetical protein
MAHVLRFMWVSEVIRTKGIDQVTVDDLIEEITPKARGAFPSPSGRCVPTDPHARSFDCSAAAVPESIKGDMLDKIKAFIEKSA